jgi:hypothetical protein
MQLILRKGLVEDLGVEGGDSIEIDWGGGVDWFYVACNREKIWAAVNSLMKIRVV